MRPRKVTYLLFVAFAMAFHLAPAAQSTSPAAAATEGRPQSEEQKRGDAVFHKNCHLCHIYTNQKKELKIQASTELIGLFKKPAITEEGVRQLVQQGIPRLMPSFRYTLGPSEMDDLIAYLKIR